MLTSLLVPIFLYLFFKLKSVLAVLAYHATDQKKTIVIRNNNSRSEDVGRID